MIHSVQLIININTQSAVISVAINNQLLIECKYIVNNHDNSLIGKKGAHNYETATRIKKSNL